MVSCRENYKDDSLNQAIQRALSGEPASAVSRETMIPYSTIPKWVAAAQEGVLRAPQVRGLPP
jgi:transposase-like protein